MSGSGTASGVPAVLHVVPGPREHGVTRHALDLLDRPALSGCPRVRILTDGDTSDAAVDEALLGLPHAHLVHLHLTDHLLAPTAGECAGRVLRLAQRRPVSLTLHDLPQPADGPGRYERRRDAHAAMAGAARGVVVASAHERDLLGAALEAASVPGPPIEIVPLPIVAPDVAAAPRAPQGPRSLVVFGFVYPGKGHTEALEALTGLPDDVGLLALGRVSPGHEDLVTDLTAQATRSGRRFEVSGYVDDAAVLSALQEAAVPVAPHRHVSASGSIGSWLTAGRRPLVPAGRYVDELESRSPGALLRYGPGTDHADLAEAARAALEDPGLTWLGDVRVGPGPEDVARRLADVTSRWARDARAGATS